MQIFWASASNLSKRAVHSPDYGGERDCIGGPRQGPTALSPTTGMDDVRSSKISEDRTEVAGRDVLARRDLISRPWFAMGSGNLQHCSQRIVGPTSKSHVLRIGRIVRRTMVWA